MDRDVCAGCGRAIDPAFDSGVLDERGRVWHTTCRVLRGKRRTRLWTLAVVAFVVLGSVVGIALQFVPQGTSPATGPMSTRLAATLKPEMEQWLNANSAAGEAVEVSTVTCTDVGKDQYKCAVRGVEKADGARANAHMTVLATVDGDKYTWAMTEGWTAGE